MNVDREVIVDLLPVYFSGEASASTRTLVEDYFRQNPEFEKIARAASRPLETLTTASTSHALQEEKYALERAREAVQTRVSFLWIAICFTVLLLLFKIRDHRPVFLMWQERPTVGVVFASLAVFFWFAYSRMRRLRGPLPQGTVYLWLAVFYSLMPLLFRIENHRIVWIAFSGDAVAASVFIVIALLFWIAYFVTRFGDIQFTIPFTGGRLSGGAWRRRRR